MLKRTALLALVLGVSQVAAQDITVQASLDPVCSAASAEFCLNSTCNLAGPNPIGAPATMFFCNQPDCTNQTRRRIDGVCNNMDIGRAFAGSTFQQQIRVAPESTANLNNQNEALDISDLMLNTQLQTPNAFGRSNLLIIFGQFVDHDITLIELEPVTTPIRGAGSIPNIDFPLSRRVAEGSNANFINEISAFLDLTQVYGGTEERLNALRDTGNAGRMLVQLRDNVEFLPENARLAAGPIIMAMGNVEQTFAAGDVRANEQMILIAFHTLFLRNHNRLAAQFTAAGMNDEEAFESARDLNIAQYQNIVYQEFLPGLLGPGAIAPYTGYNSSVEPAIGLTFSTALYRVGHSGVANEVVTIDAAGNRATRLLADAFFNPQGFLDQPNAVGALLLGSQTRCHERIDLEVQDSLRRLLFGNTGPALDLGALNIQRGRDHHLESFNAVRASLGMPATSMTQLDPVNTCVAEELNSMFGTNFDAVPSFVAGLAEAPVGGSQVGPTINAAIVDQFTRLRDGDRFFFENRVNGISFTEEELSSIRTTTISDIIVANTFVTADQIGVDAFASQECCSVAGNADQNMMCIRNAGAITMGPVARCNVEDMAAVNAVFYPGTRDPLTNLQYDCECVLAEPVVASSAFATSAAAGVVLALVSLFAL